MDQETKENNITYLEQDLLLQEKNAIQNNQSTGNQGTPKEDWDRIDEIPNHVDKINMLLIVGIAISFILLVIGLAVVIKNGLLYGLYLIIFSLFMTGVFTYGIFAFRWYQNKAAELSEKKHYKHPEELDTSAEYSYLNIFHFLLILFFICCLFVTIVCFGFQNYYLNPIRTAAMNQDSWKKAYGDITYDKNYNDAVLLLYIGGFCGLVLSIFSLTFMIISFCMLGSYKSWQTINEFLCIAIFIIGFILIYYAVYILRFRNLINLDKAMPDNFPIVLIVAGVFGILVSILGFIGNFLENKTLIKHFAIISIISAVILIITLVTSISSTVSFKDEYKCKDLLEDVGQTYAIEILKCDRKYTFVQNTLENMKCPKNRIVSAWDINLGINSDDQKETYGCLDAGCCSNAYEGANKNMKFISVYLIFMLMFTIAITVGAFLVLNQLPDKTQFGIFDMNIKWILLGLGFSTAVVILTVMVLIPEIHPSPFISHKVESSKYQGVPESSVIQVDSDKVNTRSAFLKQVVHNSTIITENKAPCGDKCLDVEYNFQLSSNDGVFTPNQTLLQNANITVFKNNPQGSGWIVEFTGNDKNLEDFSLYYNFVNNCPLFPASINVKVAAKAIPAKEQINSLTAPSFLENNSRRVLNLIQINSELNGVVAISVNATTVNVDKMTLGQTVNVLDKTINYSFVSNDKQIVTGRIVHINSLYALNNVWGASIKVTADEFPKCPSQNYNTNINGVFTTNGFYVAQKDAPIKYTFEIKAQGYLLFKQPVYIGGIGWEKIKDLGDTLIFSEIEIRDTYDLKTKLFDSLTNKPLQGVNVTIYKGILSFPNTENEKKSEMQNSNFISSENSLIHWNTTDIQGNFVFEKLPANKYTIVFEKKSYYREIKRNFIYFNYFRY
jgi:hypothetical protein